VATMFVATDCRRGRPRKSATPADSGLAVAVADVEAVTVTPNVLAASSAVRPEVGGNGYKVLFQFDIQKTGAYPDAGLAAYKGKLPQSAARASCSRRKPRLRRACE